MNTTRRALFGALMAGGGAVTLQATTPDKPRDYEPHLSAAPDGSVVIWRVTRRWEPEHKWTRIDALARLDGKKYGLAMVYTPEELAVDPRRVGRKFQLLRESLDRFVKYRHDPRFQRSRRNWMGDGDQ